MATKKSAPTEDVMLVHGRSEDGKTLAILRKRGEELSAGLLRVAEEGKPLHGEVVRLTPRRESPLLCDVDVLHAPPSPAPNTDASDSAPEPSAAPAAPGAASKAGPTQVASPAYRSGWDAIWGDGADPLRGAKRDYDPRLN